MIGLPQVNRVFRGKCLLLVVLLSWITLLGAQTEGPSYQDLPEEDEDLARPTEYLFNPIQAAEEFRVGEFYWKRGSYEAAAGRYEEATKWNPGYAQAFFKLGEAHMKLAEAAAKDDGKEQLRISPSAVVSVDVPEGAREEQQQNLDAARQAYEKYLELEPKGGHANQVRKQLAQLEPR